MAEDRAGSLRCGIGEEARVLGYLGWAGEGHAGGEEGWGDGE